RDASGSSMRTVLLSPRPMVSAPVAGRSYVAEASRPTTSRNVPALSLPPSTDWALAVSLTAVAVCGRRPGRGKTIAQLVQVRTSRAPVVREKSMDSWVLGWHGRCLRRRQMQTTEDRTEERVSDYESVLFARAMRLARSQSDAWDLVQDTYERALRGQA